MWRGWYYSLRYSSSAMLAALRQNARVAAGPTLPVDALEQNEIDRCALKCKHYLRSDGRE
jgi:hypothetical protein